MSKLIDWIINLGTGVLGSIIASIIISLFLGWWIIRSKRDTKVNIQSSKIKGDIIGGDKTTSFNQDSNFTEKRKSHIKVSRSEISGDVIAGNKEK